MKLKFYFLSIASTLAIGTMSAQSETDNDIIMLDLSKATTELTFNEENGMWNGTYDDDETEIESQVFSIEHGSWADYNYWYGFTASNSTSNTYEANTLLYQFSNMAKGGILLNDDGTIMTNEFGAPIAGKEMPYLVGFSSGSSITFNTGKTYEVVGAYFNLNTYTFYSILYGDGFARAFTQDDLYYVTVIGIDAEENEKTVQVNLASYNNGCLNASTGWTYVDLSELGEVEELRFNLNGTDSGDWGLNTPSYFCLDKLMVKEVTANSVAYESVSSRNHISYDKTSKTINLNGEGFAMVYDATGRVVMTSETQTFSVADLPAGVYVVKAGKNRLKFMR